MSEAITRAVTYGTLLRLDEILELAHLHEGSLDRRLFLTSHQIYEVWFGLLLRHLEQVRSALFDGDQPTAVVALERLPAIMSVLVGQFDVLASLVPEEFERIRAELGTASGFQSVQFRELEFLCGLRDERFATSNGFTDRDRARLIARLGEPSVGDAYDHFLLAGDERAWEAGRVRAALLSFDECVMLWRARHAALAERFLGGRPGTAGSAGSAYLWGAARKRLFPSVWP